MMTTTAVSANKNYHMNPIVNTYETTNRKLENFLFVHDIFHKSWYKSANDGLTVWVYEDTEELRKVVAEYMEIARRRSERRSPMSISTRSRYLN